MEQNVQPVSLWKTRPFQLFPIQYILQHIPYSGKLSRISQFCDYLQKFSLQNLWGVASFGAAKASIRESFLRKKSYFHQFVKVFSLESFLLYGTVLHLRAIAGLVPRPSPSFSSLAVWPSFPSLVIWLN